MPASLEGWLMPPVVAALTVLAVKVGAVSAAGALAFLGSTAFTIASWAVTIAATVGYSTYSRRQAKKKLAAAQANLDTGRNVMVRDPIAPRRIVYGQVPVSGPIVFMHVSGTNNEYLHLIVKLADHECEELGEIKFNDEIVPLDGSGNATGTYAGHARIKKFLGLAAGERDTDLESESGGLWTADHLGKSVARLHIRLKHNPDLFQQGVPAITCMVKGKKVLDTRTSTTAWSANVALCLADYLMDTRFGKAVPLARIYSADLNEAANICDEDVVLADASTENRYTCNGVVHSDEDPEEIIAALADAMAGFVGDPGGKWLIRAGAWRTPGPAFGDSDLVGSFSVTPRLSRQETFNGVRGVYYSAVNQWAAADFPAVKNDTYMSWDGGVRLWRDVAYRFTTSPATAQRLAKIELERGRQQITVVAEYTLRAIRYQPGDVIPINRDRLGWSEKYFEVLDWTFVVDHDAQQMPVLKVKMVLRETAQGVWDWNDGEETTVDLAPNTTLPNSRTVPTPATPTLSTSNFQQTDGTITPRLKVQWSAPANSLITSGGFVEIEYKKTADSDWTVWTTALRGDATFDFITDVQAGVSYDVRIRFRNVSGARGSYSATATHTVSNDTTAPTAPTGLAALATPGSITLTWNRNSETDEDLYRIYRNTSNDPGTATLLTGGEVRGTSYTDWGAGSGTKYYWVTCVDTSNNESAKSSGVNSTANPATGNKIVNVFKRAAAAPSAPSGNYVPAGWSDTPPAADGNPLWLSVAEVSSTGVLVGAWSTPIRLDGANGTNGTDGDDGDSIYVEYSVDGTGSWHSTFTTGDFYMRVKVGVGGSWSGPIKISGEIEDGEITTVKLANGAVSQVTAVTAATATGLTNGSWTEIAAITVNALAGQDVVLQAGFAYADEGASFTTDFDVRILRDGTPIISTGQTARPGQTDFVFFGITDPDLGSGVTEYTLEIKPIGGGGTATPSARDPYLNATILKDRLN
jgi:hypothetical protein